MTTLRPAQSLAAAWLSTRKRGCVVAPAGSGKTVIAAGALDLVLKKRTREKPPKIGWLANTIEQCVQAQMAITGFAIDADVKIACAAANTDWSDRDCLVIDEAHHATAPGWAEQIATCKGALWGFTATPWTGDEERDAALKVLFGEFHTIERSEVSHTLAPAAVRFLNASDDVGMLIDEKVEKDMKWRERYWKRSETEQWKRVLWDKKSTAEQILEANAKLRGIYQELRGQVCWQACVEIGIVNNTARNEAAIVAARKHTEPTLILVNQVEHAKWFAETLPNAVACFSKMGKKKRATALQDFRDGKVQRLVATSLADEGLDLPMASVLILVSGGRSEAKTIQRTGRVLRRHEGKGTAVIYDFSDLQHQLMAKHSRKRREIYEELGYAVES